MARHDKGDGSSQQDRNADPAEKVRPGRFVRMGLIDWKHAEGD
jgi:hypothetical protein